MKKLIAHSIASILLSVVTLGLCAQAQSPERTIKADIPFEFSVGNRIFPVDATRWCAPSLFCLSCEIPMVGCWPTS